MARTQLPNGNTKLYLIKIPENILKYSKKKKSTNTKTEMERPSQNLLYIFYNVMELIKVLLMNKKTQKIYVNHLYHYITYVGLQSKS